MKAKWKENVSLGHKEKEVIFSDPFGCQSYLLVEPFSLSEQPFSLSEQPFVLSHLFEAALKTRNIFCIYSILTEGK